MSEPKGSSENNKNMKNQNKNKNTNAVTNTRIVPYEPKKSYKNMLLTPPPPVVSINSVLSGNIVGNYRGEMINMIEHYGQKDPFVYPYSIYPIQLIVEAEEDELWALQDYYSQSYQNLYSIFKQVAKAVGCNILLVVGHVEICTDYIDRVNFKNPPNRDYPHIVFIVGCNSADYIDEFNAKEELRNYNYYFMGFKNLTHVINGDIYICEHPHVNLPNMDCRYPGSDKDADEIINSDERYNLYNRTNSNKLIQCINAKFDRFVNTYKEDIGRRNCSKLTAESVIRKIMNIKNADGTMLPHDEISHDDLVFTLSDLESCAGANRCKIPINTQAEKIARQFDHEMIDVTVYHEIEKIMRSAEYKTSDEEQHRKEDEQIVGYLNSLTVEQAVNILNKISNEKPLYFSIFIHKFPISMREIIKKYKVNWLLTDTTNTKRGLIHYLILQLDTFGNKQTYPYEYTYYTVKELFRLFLSIMEVSRTSLLKYSGYNYTPFADLIRENAIRNLPLIEFYFKYFPGITSSKQDTINYNDMIDKTKSKTTLLGLFIETVPQNENFKKLLEILFVYGLDPNKQIKTTLVRFTYTPLEFYEKCAIEYIDTDIVKLFFIYGAKDVASNSLPYLKNRIDYYTDMTKSKTSLQSLIYQLRYDFTYESSAKSKERTKFRLDNIVEFCTKAAQTYTDVLQFIQTTDLKALRKTTEEVERIVDADLAPYVEGARAIPRIKEKYTEIQKYIRKQPMNSLLKEEFLDEFSQIYKSEQTGENEGNSAVRRLNSLTNAFEKARTLIPEFPGKPVAPKPPKVKPVRAPKVKVPKPNATVAATNNTSSNATAAPTNTSSSLTTANTTENTKEGGRRRKTRRGHLAKKHRYTRRL